jgi:DNA-binding NarL/FixJ family response regulator
MTPQRVLIVDDHALVRDGVRALLAGHAEVVGEAGDAAQARKLVAALAPSVVLLDIGMKGGDGLTLAAELARQPSPPALLMLSMYDGAEYLQRARKAGARGYVRKDAPSSEILAALAAVASGGSHWPAPDAPTDPLQRRMQLTEREREIMRGLARGASSKQLAAALAASVRTVDTHRLNIRRKLRIEGQAELIRYAVEHFGGPA